MDISIYSINEILWIDSLENYLNRVEYPIMGNIFEDVTDLFPKYFTKIANKNTKIAKKNTKKQIKMKTKYKLKKIIKLIK
jgi:hypothetical protein